MYMIMIESLPIRECASSTNLYSVGATIVHATNLLPLVANYLQGNFLHVVKIVSRIWLRERKV